MATWENWPFRPRQTGKCPHCGVEVHFEGAIPEGKKEATPLTFPLRLESPGTSCKVTIAAAGCPRCRLPILSMIAGPAGEEEGPRLVWPRLAVRSQLPEGLPQDIASDYKEAALVLADSPKASAALSRRCLQNLLREAANTTKKDLAEQIAEVLPKLPP